MDDFCAQQKCRNEGNHSFATKRFQKKHTSTKSSFPLYGKILSARSDIIEIHATKKCCGVHGDMISLFGFVKECLVNIGFKIGLIAG